MVPIGSSSSTVTDGPAAPVLAADLRLIVVPALPGAAAPTSLLNMVRRFTGLPLWLDTRSAGGSSIGQFGSHPGPQASGPARLVGGVLPGEPVHDLRALPGEPGAWLSCCLSPSLADKGGSAAIYDRKRSEERPQSHLRDSNPGLQLYESCALPAELRWLVSMRLLARREPSSRSGRLPGENETLPAKLRRRHHSKLPTYRRGAKGVKVDQPELKASTSGHHGRSQDLIWDPGRLRAGRRSGNGRYCDPWQNARVPRGRMRPREKRPGRGQPGLSGFPRPAVRPRQRSTGPRRNGPEGVDNRRSRSPRWGGPRQDRRRSCSGPNSSHDRRDGDGPRHRRGERATT